MIKTDILSLLTAPLSTDDLPPLPKDYTEKGPDFVGIGTPKSGTTWWYRMIMQHPQVVPNRLASKEISYFLRFSYHSMQTKDIKLYNQMFAAPAGNICGEWSPGYYRHPFALKNLEIAAPGTKKIIIFRNPVDRMLSHINQLLRKRVKILGLKGIRLELYKKTSLINDVIPAGYYWQTIKDLTKDELLVLQYEKLKSESTQELIKTYRFLEIDDNYIPQDLLKPYKPQAYIVDPLTKKERANIAQLYLEDTKKLVQLFPDIDINLWPDFVKHI